MRTRPAISSVALAVCLACAVLKPSRVSAGTEKDFFQNTALNQSANYNPTGLPNNTNDVLLTTTSTGLTLSAANLTMGSLNQTNNLSYTIKNNTTTATNSNLTLGGGGNADSITGSNSGDLIYLGGTTSNLTIQGANGNTGTGALNVVLAQSGNFDVAQSGASLSITSNISGTGFSITKTGAGVLTLGGTNTYSGGTFLSGGSTTASHDSAFGTGNVSLTGGAITLTLAGGATNNYINDNATLSYVSGDTINLNYSGTDTVAGLIVDGVAVAPGVYGATALNPDGVFAGTGTITVLAAVPEASTWSMLIAGAGLLGGVQVLRRRRA